MSIHISKKSTQLYKLYTRHQTSQNFLLTKNHSSPFSISITQQVKHLESLQKIPQNPHKSQQPMRRSCTPALSPLLCLHVRVERLQRCLSSTVISSFSCSSYSYSFSGLSFFLLPVTYCDHVARRLICTICNTCHKSPAPSKNTYYTLRIFMLRL